MRRLAIKLITVGIWICGGLLPIVCAWAAADYYCDTYYRREVQAQKFEQAFQPSPTDFVVDRGISFQTPFAIRNGYRERHQPASRVLISGPGGNGAAAVLGGYVLRSIGLPLRVPAHSVCASACVGMMLTAGNWTVDPDGFLLFHAGRRYVPPYEDCQPCTFLKEHWPYGNASTSTRRAMLGWANEVSPKLATFLNACSKNPLDTYEGIALSGRQIELIASAKNDFNCDDISNQDVHWLTSTGQVGKFIADD